MGHGHAHHHGTAPASGPLPAALDAAVPDEELAPADVSRRGCLRDGNPFAPGLLGAAVDRAGPVMNMVGDADPGQDRWVFANPILVLAR